MNYIVKTTEPANEKADCLIVGIFKDRKLSQAAKRLDEVSQGALTQILEKGDLPEQLGATLPIYNISGIIASRVLLTYCGQESTFKVGDFRKVLSCVGKTIKTMKLNKIVNYLTDIQVQNRDYNHKIRQSIEIIEDCFYSFNRFKTKNLGKALSPKFDVVFNLPPSTDLSQAEFTLNQAKAITAGIKLTKDLANLPANICTPKFIAEQAEQLAEHADFYITVLKKEDIVSQKMGALLAVAQGSEQPPRFVILEYKGGNEQKPVVIIGKGVTFDSGGICLKPAQGMEEMKFDMSGAASVLGTFKAITELKLPINLVGLMPLTENLPSGTAAKPGDIVTSLSGQTIEVINTDAEGRLILADALTYSERFNPDVVIDIATLTGAIIISLGAVATGLMSNNAILASQLEKAGEQSLDRVWPLPLWNDYQEQIDSNIADVSNIGIGGAKSITAACFLSRFAEKFHWAHLDIAGTAWESGKDKTATGRPVSLLVQFLLNRCINT